MTISEAVKQGSEGSIIFVQAGVYRESLVITRGVTIVGEGSALVQLIHQQSNTVHITGATSRVTIKDISVCLAGSGSFSAMLIDKDSEVLIEKCDMSASNSSGDASGIRTSTNAKVTVQNTRVVALVFV